MLSLYAYISPSILTAEYMRMLTELEIHHVEFQSRGDVMLCHTSRDVRPKNLAFISSMRFVFLDSSKFPNSHFKEIRRFVAKDK
jgi:hypothetical protein